jgi:hypothetical protein
MKIVVQRPNPDGLDPVYEAYQVLRDVFKMATVVQDDCYYEDGSYAGTYQWLILPTGDAYPADDTNPLDELEEWLVEHFGIQPDEEGPSRPMHP